jgi:nucleotide-binding universal stress UspA family protein
VYKQILIPTDGSPLSEAAIKQGVALAKVLHASITGVSVMPPFHVMAMGHAMAVEPMIITETPADWDKACQALAESHLAVIRETAKAEGVPCETVQAVDDNPYQAIIETAKSRGCDLIFMASHGRRGLAAFVLGSETTKVLTHSKIPVLVCR